MSDSINLDTAAPESVQVQDAPSSTDQPDYTPSLDTVCTAYTQGRIAKRTAQSWLTDQLNSAVRAQNWPVAMSVQAVIDQLQALAPVKARKSGPEPSDYASVILARIDALRHTANQLASAELVPGDLPDDLRDAVYAIVKVALDDDTRTVTPADHPEFKTYAKGALRNTVTRNSPVDHLNAILAGNARMASGAGFTLQAHRVYGVRELAGLRSDVYPAGDCSEGALRNYFNGVAKAGVPAGWSAGTTAKGALGIVWNGPEDDDTVIPQV